jgi:hexosaminidase
MQDPVFFPRPRTFQPLSGVVDTRKLSDMAALRAFAVPGGFESPEAYRLEISPERISLDVGGEAALPYAWAHLQQWRDGRPEAVPAGILEDAPVFARRGFMLDISRCKVPTREGLARWVRLLAAFRFNELQLYTEHTFAYSKHEAVWRDSSPMTVEDILWLQDFCTKHGIMLVPNQNCFGHFERWIKHPAYRKYAESPDGFVTPWGERRDCGSVLKPDAASLDLVTGLVDELLPLFRAPRVNIGCDETFELGQGASKARCEREGTEAVYTAFVRQVMDHVIEKHGKQPEFWGDILKSHSEQLVHLPKEAVALEWGYEAGHPFEAHLKTFAQSGLEFLVCPGSSSWQSFGGRTDNMLTNIREAAQSGLKHGARGLLLTDWGDRGHLQLEPVTWPALAWTGLCAWNPESATPEDAEAWCDREAFDGISGTARRWMDLGRVSEQTAVHPNNSNVLFKCFLGESHKELTRERLLEARVFLESLPAAEGEADAWHQTRRNLELSIQRGLGEPLTGLDDLKEEHARLWRRFNREGGLEESLKNYPG